VTELHPYTLKLLRACQMQAGGYYFANDDFSVEEWIDLGRVRGVLNPDPVLPPIHCPFLKRQ